MTSLFEILLFILNIMWFLVIAHILISWLVAFQVLNMRQPLVQQIYFGLQRIMDPIYKPIRKILPSMGGLDLAPMVVILGIFAAQRILANNIGLFG
ncbi:MAG: YggT family protein [Rhodobacteraceae bacterium]|nr:YggT family protein [Paracoccaceae bacterium]